MENAFLRHSTSKIRSAEDLTHLSSLGFPRRSVVEYFGSCKSGTDHKDKRRRYWDKIYHRRRKRKNAGGDRAPDGTTFLVRQLFSIHLPGANSLKTPMTEAKSHISDLLTRLALSHPDISFRFINNGQVKLHIPGTGR